MKRNPNCKINLGLHVVERRPDGYHNLETLFVPVPLCDELTIEKADTFSFQQEGLVLDNAPEDNLCVRAYRMLRADYSQVGTVAMRLRKQIPFGAGLGGGSSDAACVLKMLADEFSLSCSTEDLERYAARLGADCAFFIKGIPAYATGIGDVLEPIDLDISGERLVLLKPNDKVTTKEAYGGIVPKKSSVDLREAVRRPVSEWRDLIVNDFEASVFPLHPRIAWLKGWLYRQGAHYASMTGSGAAVFALFDKSTRIDFSEIPPQEILLK
jgi:4-diphosphocytidyl-2-C-methyl-D-erythritol kinase